MGKIDIATRSLAKTLVAKAATSATVAVVGMEVADYLAHMFILDVGAHTADDLTVTFQESDDNSTWTDIADADLYGDLTANDFAITADNDNTLYMVGYKGHKRYIGVTIVDGGTGDAVVGVYVVASMSKDIPA